MTKRLLFLTVILLFSIRSRANLLFADDLSEAYAKICLKANQPVVGYGKGWAEQISKVGDDKDSSKMGLNQVYKKYVESVYNSVDCKVARDNEAARQAAGTDDSQEYFKKVPKFGLSGQCDE